jgi:Ca-activated chloride channel family protein
VPESLTLIAKPRWYVNGNNTKEVLEYVKNALNNIQKTEFGYIADFQSQFQWFWLCFVVICRCFIGKKTS